MSDGLVSKSLADFGYAASAGGGYLAGWLLGGKGVLLAVLLFILFMAITHRDKIFGR